MHRIGIDIGRVLIGPVVGGCADTSFLGSRLQEALKTPPAPGAFAGVTDLVERTGGDAWLVSKCGPVVQAKTRAWLEHHRFWDITGMNRSHLRFCRERKEKADHARKLGLTVMIDDRTDVLHHLRELVQHCLLFGEQTRPAPPWTTHVHDWADVQAWAEIEWSSASDAPPVPRPRRRG